MGATRSREYAAGATSSSTSARVLEDAFGLQRAEIPLDAPWTLLVYPRLVELDRLFSEGGTYAQDGRRLLLRRPSGFDLHSVRDYEEGESLRKVHWRSTAKRGELMVKELEDAPRDEVAVLLDGEASAVVGESFDVRFVLPARFCSHRLGADVVPSCSSTALTRPSSVFIPTKPTGRKPTICSRQPRPTATRRQLRCSATRRAPSRVRSS